MMNSERDDRQFEAYLRGFQPRQPRPLPGRGKVMILRWRRPAVTAVVLGAVLAVALLSMRHAVSTPAPPLQVEMPHAAENGIGEQISLGRLSALAKQDPALLESHLDHVSTRLLPDVRSGHGVLKTLSAE